MVATSVADREVQVGNGIAWLDEIQTFYRERSAIEREYSQKLSTLAKKLSLIHI